MPKYFPSFSADQWQRLIPLSYQERCLRILEAFPIGDLEPQNLNSMINNAYSTFSEKTVLPIINLSPNQFFNGGVLWPKCEFQRPSSAVIPSFIRNSIKDYKGK